MFEKRPMTFRELLVQTHCRTEVVRGHDGYMERFVLQCVQTRYKVRTIRSSSFTVKIKCIQVGKHEKV